MTNNSAQSLPLPVLCDNFHESAQKLPDVYLLITPYHIVTAMAKVLFDVNGHKVYFLNHSSYKDLDNVIVKYAKQNKANWEYLLDVCNALVKEYYFRFNYDHYLVGVLEDLEYITPNIKDTEEKAIPLMCKKAPNSYILDFGIDKSISYSSWIVWIRDSQQHIVFYTNRDRPFYLKHIKTTLENKEQYKGIMQYWERYIAQQLTK